MQKAYDLAFENEAKYGNCPQCVLAALQDTMGIGNDDIFQSVHGLAGGLALGTTGTCGALVGGVMAISIRYGRPRSEFADGKPYDTFKIARQLRARFVEEYGGVNCRDVHEKIFGRTFELWTKEGYKEFNDAGAHVDKCPSVTGNVARWTAEILMDLEDAD